MNIYRWELLNFIFGGEVNAWEVAEAFQISIHNSHFRLKRAFGYGWLTRRKTRGILYYALSQKAWDFYEKFGSFTDHKYYGWGSGKNKKTT